MREWLREMREEKGLSQREAADQIGITFSQYKVLEYRDGLSTEEARVKTAAFFGFPARRFRDEFKKDQKEKKRGRDPKEVFEGGIFGDAERILRRCDSQLKDFKPILTVYADGSVEGDYWGALAEFRR